MLSQKAASEKNYKIYIFATPCIYPEKSSVCVLGSFYAFEMTNVNKDNVYLRNRTARNYVLKV